MLLELTEDSKRVFFNFHTLIVKKTGLIVGKPFPTFFTNRSIAVILDVRELSPKNVFYFGQLEVKIHAIYRTHMD